MSQPIPQDPAILQSYINTLLRDHYSSLQELCDDRDININQLQEALSSAGLEYNPTLNKVW